MGKDFYGKRWLLSEKIEKYLVVCRFLRIFVPDMTIEGFLNYLQLERNYSPQTVKSYGEDLRAFEEFFGSLEGQLTWETVDADVIRDWMEQMMDRGNHAATVNRRLSSLRAFFRHAMRQGLADRNPAKDIVGPKKSRPLPQFVKESEMNRLIDELPWEDTYNNVRARTIIIMLYETGLRVSELVSLDDDGIDFVNSQLKVTGKRNKQRLIPFGAELESQLKTYLAKRDEMAGREEGALFLTDKGRRMNTSQVRYEVKKWLSRVTSLKKRSPHVLRHSFATAMLNHEAGLESVKKLLGHESLTTTEIYTHTTFEQLKKVYRSAHPRA